VTGSYNRHRQPRGLPGWFRSIEGWGLPAGHQRGLSHGHGQQSRADGRRYVAEQKSELAFEAYRYLRLQEPVQLTHHSGRRAFNSLSS